MGMVRCPRCEKSLPSEHVSNDPTSISIRGLSLSDRDATTTPWKWVLLVGALAAAMVFVWIDEGATSEPPTASADAAVTHKSQPSTSEIATTYEPIEETQQTASPYLPPIQKQSREQLLRTLVLSVERRRIQADVQVKATDTDTIILRTDYCNDGRLRRAVESIREGLVNTGFKNIRCFEPLREASIP